MATIQTPYGRIEYQGVLAEDSPIVIHNVDGNGENVVAEMPLSRLIAMSNGAVLRYLPEPPPRAGTLDPISASARL